MPQRDDLHSEKLSAVLVDIDGTLIDSNDAHARAWMGALKAHSHEFPFERIRPLIGMGGDKLLSELLGITPDSRLAKAINAARADHFGRLELHALSPTPGARDLLLRIRAARIKVVVATSAQANETDALLRQAGLDDLVDQAADAGDASRSKPDPDIVRRALQKSAVRPSAAIMVGDTPYDIEAAAKAGVRAIALRCGGWWNDSAFEGAVAIYDAPIALLDGDRWRMNR